MQRRRRIEWVRELARQVLVFLGTTKLHPLEIAILALICGTIFTHDLLAVEFQPDETYWIVSSMRLDRFLMLDLSAPIWAESSVSYEVRPLPSYLVGMAQRIGGIASRDLPTYWNWSMSATENAARGALPTERVLLVSRFPMAMIGALCILLTTVFIAGMHSRFAGYLFFICGFSDYFLLHLRRAMSESPQLLFTILAMLATSKLMGVFRDKSRKRLIIWSLIVGALCGLAGQSKLTGLGCAIFAILSLLFEAVRGVATERGERLWRVGTATGVIVLTALAAFVLSYPFLYRQPFERIAATFLFRERVLNDQLQIYNDQTIATDQRPMILARRVFNYPIAALPGQPAGLALSILDLGFVGYGVIFLAARVLRRPEHVVADVPLLAAALVCAVPMLFTPLDWDRYYLLPIFFVCVFFSIGVAQFILGMLQVALAERGRRPVLHQ